MSPHADHARNIVLAGFMGTGKSTIGQRLAARLGWVLVDTDEMVERRAGKPISRIFAEDGEPAFRELESAVAAELVGLERHVIATGGGMVLREENLRALERAGLVVLLEASPETIYERTRRHSHRPLLQGPDPQGNIQRLLEARREAYGRIRRRVATDGLTHNQVVEQIMDLIQQTMEDPGTPAEVRVELGERSYPIRIGQGWIGGLGAALGEVFRPRAVAVVTNAEIRRLWGAPVVESLEAAGLRVSVCEIPPGEDHKTLATVSMIWDHLLEARHTRQSGIVALGGGIVGDIAGFAAAGFMRGVSFIQLPTTLLAMVDSSVGGKTGVNHPAGKNLIGAFWQPTYVGIELDFLSTLPAAELRAGMAEVIKYGIIADEAMFVAMEREIEPALAGDSAALGRLIRRSCEIKAEVVAGDERESGRRAILNFGHTFGHAAEALSGYQAIRHGEGVAMGMVAAMRLGAMRGLVSEADVTRVEALVARAGLPTRLLRFAPERYWEVMGSDKKVRDGRIRFVLPEAIGRVGVYDDVTREEVMACLGVTMAAE